MFQTPGAGPCGTAPGWHCAQIVAIAAHAFFPAVAIIAEVRIAWQRSRSNSSSRPMMTND
jgi:hypothetical protein